MASSLAVDARGSRGGMVNRPVEEIGAGDEYVEGHRLGAPVIDWRWCSCGHLNLRTARVCLLAELERDHVEARARALRIEARERRALHQALGEER